MKKLLLLLLIITMLPAITQGQSSFSLVKQVLQSNCAGSSCHDGSTAFFNVNQSESNLYASLVNVSPINPAANTKGHKLVVPGNLEQSFLLRKMGHGISTPLTVSQQEGSAMPKDLPALPNKEIELVRQWILFGAPLAGNVVDTALINNYYDNGGIDGTYAQHDPPPAGEGFQVYLGKIFVPPSTEKEYFIKYNPLSTENTEVYKVTFMMPGQAHHFVLYTFPVSTEAGYADGLRPQEQTSHADSRNPIPAASGLRTYDLPQNSAYFFPANSVYDLNLHIKNINQDSILAVDLYVNMYTQPVGTAAHYMYVTNFPYLDISIPQDMQEHTFTDIAYDSSATNIWKIWSIVTHTHKYGTDYDVYTRNPDGSRGTQVYEGMYSYENDFPMGYYPWGTDVTTEFFDDDALLEVNPYQGLIHEAKFKNTNGPNPVGWGLTSNEEMMVVSIQYILGDEITDVPKPQAASAYHLRLFPNPGKGTLSINYTLDKVEDLLIDLVNTLGQKVSTLFKGKQSQGTFTQTFDTNSLTPGVYFVRTNVSGKDVTQKLIITE